MVRKPLSLSAAQMQLLREAASGLRVEQRAGFLRDVASHLSGDGEPTDQELQNAVFAVIDRALTTAGVFLYDSKKASK